MSAWMEPLGYKSRKFKSLLLILLWFKVKLYLQYLDELNNLYVIIINSNKLKTNINMFLNIFLTYVLVFKAFIKV